LDNPCGQGSHTKARTDRLVSSRIRLAFPSTSPSYHVPSRSEIQPLLTTVTHPWIPSEFTFGSNCTHATVNGFLRYPGAGRVELELLDMDRDRGRRREMEERRGGREYGLNVDSMADGLSDRIDLLLFSLLGLKSDLSFAFPSHSVPATW
jgi:hypothetical protein